MGTTTVNLYSDKKWSRIDESNIDGDFCNLNHLYAKYYPQLPQESDSHKSSKIPLKHYAEFSNLLRDHKVEWFEKVCFKLSKNMHYFEAKDIPLLTKALELINIELKGNQKNNFNTQMIQLLKELDIKGSDLIALGYSSGGFWGTDAEAVIDSLAFKLDETLTEKIGDNLNLNPLYFGTNIFNDITAKEQVVSAMNRLK